MLYTAKCFWAGVTEDALRLAAREGSETGEEPRASFLGALYSPGGELVLCLFYSSSRASVKGASERAGMPCERVIESVWVAPHGRGGKKTC
jgi:Nickel responsive protein SCO4226-like